MKRFLAPFSELFVALSLVFFSLFFLSAGLSGTADEEPTDELHLISVSWNVPQGGRTVRWLNGVPQFDNVKQGAVVEEKWLTEGQAIVAASDDVNLRLKRWQFAWGPPSVISFHKPKSVHTEVGCTPVDVSDFEMVAVPQLSSVWAAGFLPSQVLATLGVRQNSDVSVSVRQAVNAPTDRIFDSGDSRILFLDHSGGIELAYRPQDIEKPINLKIVIPLSLVFGALKWVPNYDAGPYHVSVVVRNARGEVVDDLDVRFERSPNIEQSIASAHGTLWSGENIPILHTREDCEGRESIGLIVRITKNGAAVSFRDPTETK